MLGLGRGESTRVTQIEVTAVHEHFRGDGFQYLELRHLGEFAIVLYQTAAGLKHEVRLFHPLDSDGTSISLHRAVEILTDGSPFRTLLRAAEKELEVEMLKAKMAEERDTWNGKLRREPEGVQPGLAISEGYA